MSYDFAENSLTKGLFILFVSFQTELDSLHVKRKEKVICAIYTIDQNCYMNFLLSNKAVFSSTKQYFSSEERQTVWMPDGT